MSRILHDQATPLAGAPATVHILRSDPASGAAPSLQTYRVPLAEPVSVLVETFGTGKVAELLITKLVRELFPLRPSQIIKHLDLRKPRYLETAAFGHFGRSGDNFTWEKTDLAESLRQAAGL